MRFFGAMRPPRLRRLVQLYAGLVLYGISASMLLLAGLGVDPWDVLHQGLSRTFGLGVGTWVILVGALVLALWWPLRQRPGFGTVSNAVMVGLVMDVVLALVAPPHALPARAALLVAGVLLNAVATGAYIGAGLGAGPRDGLTLGLCARTGASIRLVRTTVELSVLLAGWRLGGTVGIGTVAYALAIGPLTHLTIPMLAVVRPHASTHATRRPLITAWLLPRLRLVTGFASPRSPAMPPALPDPASLPGGASGHLDDARTCVRTH
jgi:uncharacterized membrane protein YczE